MSGVEPSAEDSGIVESVMLVFVGIVILGIAVWAATTGREPVGVLVALVLGGGMVAVASYETVETVGRLRGAGTTNPVVVIRKDLNDRDRILKGLLKLALGWIALGLFWAFVIETPGEASRMLGELVGTRPELAAGWVLFNAVVALGIMFGSRRRRRIEI